MNPRGMRAAVCAAAIAVIAIASTGALAQIAPARTWPELRDAVQERVNRQAYPLTGMRADEVREILARISSLDRDEWARSWMQTGERYWNEGRALQATDRERAREAYIAAWRYFGFGAWPVQNSPAKKAAHERGLEAFRAYSRLTDLPTEVIRVPFEGREIVGYLQLPEPSMAARPAPLVMSVGGLDSYKEYVAEQYGPGYLAAGLGYLALDMPGTGEAPLKIDVGAERIFSRVLDSLQTRRDIDPKRIAFQGVSWGGHWAARIAYVERDRLRGSVSWAGPTDAYFQRDWQLKALGTREYLFDLFEARSAVYGVSGLDEFLAYGPRMSLKSAGLLDKPSAPLYLVNGARDTQVPIDDLYILLKSGSPKEAWVNPEGGHIGRNREWSDARIFKEVVVPWLVRTLR